MRSAASPWPRAGTGDDRSRGGLGHGLRVRGHVAFCPEVGGARSAGGHGGAAGLFMRGARACSRYAAGGRHRRPRVLARRARDRGARADATAGRGARTCRGRPHEQGDRERASARPVHDQLRHSRILRKAGATSGASLSRGYGRDAGVFPSSLTPVPHVSASACPPGIKRGCAGTSRASAPATRRSSPIPGITAIRLPRRAA